MRNETVAEAIKRRTAEKASASRRRMDMWVQVSLWGGVFASAVMTAAVAIATMVHYR